MDWRQSSKLSNLGRNGGGGSPQFKRQKPFESVGDPLSSQRSEELSASDINEACESNAGLTSLTAEEWAIAIVVAYETGRGLKEAAKAELRKFTSDIDQRNELRRVLLEAGYGRIFGLE